MKRKLAILTTHPIQYQAPWFRSLNASGSVDLCVYFGHRASSTEQAAAGFGVEFDWDIPILEGYPYFFLRNAASRPSALTFSGIDVPEIAEIVRTGRLDALLVHGWHYKGAWQAITACWRNGTPVMVRSDSHLHTKRNLLKRLLKWPLYRAFIPRLDLCLPVGSWSRDYFLHYGADPDRICVVPHVVDYESFNSRAAGLEKDRSALRRRFSVRDDSTLYLFVGKFIEKKRPMDFAAAVQNAFRSGAPVQGLMVGDGELRKSCEAFVGESGAPVQFAGFLNQTEIVEAYVAADALVVPSDGRETWGLVINEAMACGRPCIVSDRVGSGPDMVELGSTGAVFPCGNVGALADLLNEYSRPGRLPSMKEAVLQTARRYRAAEGVAATLKALQAVSA